MFEERVLIDPTFRVTLRYTPDQEIDRLVLIHDNGDRITISGIAVSEAPEKIYELLRECNISWFTHHPHHEEYKSEIDVTS